MLEKINEKVDVITIYKRFGTIVSPYKIRWNGRDYRILKIGYHHKVRQGSSIHHIFSVSSESLAFRLRFDSETMYWTLEEVSDGFAA
jgi:hypothetical protein